MRVQFHSFGKAGFGPTGKPWGLGLVSEQEQQNVQGKSEILGRRVG